MSIPRLENFKIKKKLTKRLCYTLYDAVDQRNGNRVFLKILDPKLCDNEEVRSSFRNGARIAKMLKHPNIAKIYDYGENQGHYYISSEPIEFEPLRTLILETFSLSFEDLTKIFTTISKTLTYTHLRGVVHGLLNPTSIYINSNSDIKIDDLGLNWYIEYALKKETKESICLAQYIAPEYYHTPEKADGRGDIYSLGIILFEFLIGNNPFQRDSLSDIQEQHLTGKIPGVDYAELNLPVEFGEVIHKAVNKIPEKRFQNSSEFVQSLEFLKEKYILAPVDVDISEENVAHFDSYITKKQSPHGRDGFVKLLRKNFASSGLTILVLLAIAVFATNHFLISPEVIIEDNGARESAPNADYDPDNLRNNELSSVANALSTLDSLKAAMLNEANLSETNHQPQSKTSLPGDGQPANKLNVTPESDIVLSPITTMVDIIVHSDNNPIEARIFLDEEFVGNTDQEGRLTLSQLEINKTYTVRVSKEGFSTITKYLTPSEDNTIVMFEMEPRIERLGILVLEASPGADSVFVNGNHYNYKMPIETKLQPGKHRVRMVNSRLSQSWEQTVEIKTGQVVRINHDFTKIEYGKVAVSLKNAFEYGFGFVYIDGRIWPEKRNTTPLEINLPVGLHKVEVKRDGFVASPVDTTIEVKSKVKVYVSFLLSKKEN